MIRTRKTMILALLVPILALVGLASYSKYKLSTGEVVVLPISGSDPRDLLSGHYLRYQINYGVDGICPQSRGELPIIGRMPGYICLEPKKFTFDFPDGCSKVIRGVCNRGGFKAGVEKYYVPEDKAKFLEDQVRSKSASIVLSVAPDGYAQVRDLLIDGRSWKEQ